MHYRLCTPSSLSWTNVSSTVVLPHSSFIKAFTSVYMCVDPPLVSYSSRRASYGCLCSPIDLALFLRRVFCTRYASHCCVSHLPYDVLTSCNPIRIITSSMFATSSRTVTFNLVKISCLSWTLLLLFSSIVIIAPFTYLLDIITLIVHYMWTSLLMYNSLHHPTTP